MLIPSRIHHIRKDLSLRYYIGLSLKILVQTHVQHRAPALNHTRAHKAVLSAYSHSSVFVRCCRSKAVVKNPPEPSLLSAPPPVVNISLGAGTNSFLYPSSCLPDIRTYNIPPESPLQRCSIVCQNSLARLLNGNSQPYP